MPADFFVKNGSNMRARSSAGIPGPKSSTDNSILDWPFELAVSLRRRASGGRSALRLQRS